MRAVMVRLTAATCLQLESGKAFARDDGGHGRCGGERNAELAPTWRSMPGPGNGIGEVRHQDPVLACNRALLAARATERGAS
jgi:hypothetical protein